MAERLSLYDYLAFVVPGATILFVAVYGYDGWPRGEPGGAGTLGLVAASFVVGYINAAIGNWLEPVLLGGRPGAWPSSLWGTLRGPSRYDEADRAVIERALMNRYPGVSPEVAFRLAYTELQQSGRDGPLKLMNQHLGFTRGMATASLVGLTLNVGFALTAGTRLPILIWGPVLALGAFAFIARYRRFWRHFGDHVLRGMMTTASSAAEPSAEQGENPLEEPE